MLSTLLKLNSCLCYSTGWKEKEIPQYVLGKHFILCFEFLVRWSLIIFLVGSCTRLILSDNYCSCGSFDVSIFLCLCINSSLSVRTISQAYYPAQTPPLQAADVCCLKISAFQLLKTIGCPNNWISARPVAMRLWMNVTHYKVTRFLKWKHFLG